MCCLRSDFILKKSKHHLFVAISDVVGCLILVISFMRQIPRRKKSAKFVVGLAVAMQADQSLLLFSLNFAIALVVDPGEPEWSFGDRAIRRIIKNGAKRRTQHSLGS